MILLYILNFLTIWVFILILFHKYINKYISLSFLSFIVMFMGLYFSYINPKKFVLYHYNRKVEISNFYIKLFLIDIPLHILPFLFILYKYGLDNINDNKILMALILIFFYYSIYDISYIYKIRLRDIQILLIISIIIYIIIFNLKK